MDKSAKRRFLAVFVGIGILSFFGCATPTPVTPAPVSTEDAVKIKAAIQGLERN